MRKFLLFIVILFTLVNFYSCDDFEEIPIKEVNTEFSEDSEDLQEETTEKFTYDFSDFSDNSYSFDVPDISGYEDDIPEITETEETTESTQSTESTETTTVSTEKSTETETEQTETTSTETATTTTKTVNEDLVLIDVPYISQKDEYPTGCELVSASMLLKYYGFDITAGEFIENGYIEKKEPEKDSEGVIYCADPNKFFIGDPYKENGYGCYAPALVDALKKYLDGKFCDAVNLSGMSLDDLCLEYIDLDEPVIIWASLDMKPTEKKEKWIIKETGREFSWISNEHCLVLVGYDNNYYYFNDPQNNRAVPYRKSDVEARYNELGRQAVIVRLW